MPRAHWLAVVLVCLRLPICRPDPAGLLSPADGGVCAAPGAAGLVPRQAPSGALDRSGDDPTQGAYTRKVWRQHAGPSAAAGLAPAPGGAHKHHAGSASLRAGAGLALGALRAGMIPALPCALLLCSGRNVSAISAAARSLQDAGTAKFAALVRAARQAAGKGDAGSGAPQSVAAGAPACGSSSSSSCREGVETEEAAAAEGTGSIDNATHGQHTSLRVPCAHPGPAESGWEAEAEAGTAMMRGLSPAVFETDEILVLERDRPGRGADEDDLAVRVAVRVRPMSSREAAVRARECVEVLDETQLRLDSKHFTFDAVYGGDCQQEAIYDECVRDLVSGCFTGRNATVLAYGQTGSGKTFTMGSGGGPAPHDPACQVS